MLEPLQPDDTSHADSPALFSRTTSKHAGTTELRIDIPTELAQRMDAVLMVNGCKSRGDYVVPELTRLVDAEFHKAIMLLRTARINPLESGATGRGAE